jgi:hypothetical protein
MTLNKLLLLGSGIWLLAACAETTHYDTNRPGSGIFSGGDAYRLKPDDLSYRPVVKQQVSRNSHYYPPIGDISW